MPGSKLVELKENWSLRYYTVLLILLANSMMQRLQYFSKDGG